jgi:competence protein ComEC
VNLLAIPFISLLLVPLILAATAALAIWPWLAGLLLKLAGALIGVCWPLLSQIAASPAALWQVAPPAWWYLLAAPALLVALLPWPPWMRATALLALLPAALPTNALIAPHGFAATVFDLGRGEAVLLRTATHALLYDDGESWGSHGATTAARLAPALRYYDVRTLDAVLLPRLDADRGAGVAALNAVVPLLRLAAGDARALPPEFASCGARRRWQWDGVDFEILHSGSCTLRVSSGAAALLLPGSAAAAVQARELVPRLPPTAVVLVPGGGSATARQPLLMTTAAPRLAILSGNARSPLAASTAATLAAWRDAGAQTRITGIDGALELRFEADGRIVLWSWRKP